ncbi:kinase-like protein, partial [Gymnopus androsaceus JB14]
IVAGMTYLHSMDIVHTDLKGISLTLCGSSHNALVADFGLSQAIDDMRRTLQWMALECLDGNPETIVSDVYSLGLIIWEV